MKPENMYVYPQRSYHISSLASDDIKLKMFNWVTLDVIFMVIETEGPKKEVCTTVSACQGCITTAAKDGILRCNRNLLSSQCVANIAAPTFDVHAGTIASTMHKK